MIQNSFERPMYVKTNIAELDEYIKRLEHIRDLLVEIGNLQKQIDDIENAKHN